MYKGLRKCSRGNLSPQSMLTIIVDTTITNPYLMDSSS